MRAKRPVVALADLPGGHAGELSIQARWSAASGAEAGAPGAAVLIDSAQRLLSDLDDLDGNVTRAVQRPRGRLRVDVPAAAGRHVIAPALPDFFARFPEVVLEIGSSDRPVDLVAEGVDCVIRGGLTHDDALVARALGAFEVITCAAPSYLQRRGTPDTPQDLQRHVAPWSAGRLPLYVMYPRNRHLSARVRVFVDWVVQLYAGKFEQVEACARDPRAGAR